LYAELRFVAVTLTLFIVDVSSFRDGEQDGEQEGEKEGDDPSVRHRIAL
jgi:hypothetical protein